MKCSFVGWCIICQWDHYSIGRLYSLSQNLPYYLKLLLFTALLFPTKISWLCVTLVRNELPLRLFFVVIFHIVSYLQYNRCFLIMYMLTCSFRGLPDPIPLHSTGNRCGLTKSWPENSAPPWNLSFSVSVLVWISESIWL